METVLITGGNGLIGQKLMLKLKAQGYRVAVLTRNEAADIAKDQYYWNPDQNIIDQKATDTVDYIIHLAGAPIGEKRWTAKRKQEIIDSRVKSAQLIFNSIQNNHTPLKAFISSSATGYYGAVTHDHIFMESDPPASDFLGETCRQWEEAALQFENEGIRTVIIRTAVVLTSQGGALGKMTPLVRLGIVSPLGSGKQYLPWIHIDDICDMYVKAVMDTELSGIFNAAAPEHSDYNQFYRSLTRAMKKALWMPRVPAFILKLVFGEMSLMLLEGSRVSSEKIRQAGFHFRFTELLGALDNLLNNNNSK